MITTKNKNVANYTLCNEYILTKQNTLSNLDFIKNNPNIAGATIFVDSNTIYVYINDFYGNVNIAVNTLVNNSFTYHRNDIYVKSI